MRVVKISAGSHSAAISANGELFVWGTASFGEFRSPFRVKAMTGHNVSEVSISGQSGIALTNDGKIYSWGTNQYGELGSGDYNPKSIPFPINNISEKKVRGLALGRTFGLAIGHNRNLSSSPERPSPSLINTQSY